MTPRVNRVDLVALELLGQELVYLARGIGVTFEPAARRLGCQQLVDEMQATTSQDSPGTVRRLARLIGECLKAHED